MNDKNVTQFESYADELIRWNRRINLTAITDRESIFEKHFFDSLSLLPHLPLDGSILDVGSGAGFPGLPLAIENPRFKVICLDSIQKKVNFINHIIHLLTLKNAKAIQGRIEDLDSHERFDAIVSRGTFKTEILLQHALPHLNKGGRIIHMKGREEKLDLDALKFKIEIQKYELPKTKAARHLLIIFQK